jgi:glycosyltransferase involved in cell wall biosynthesis
VLAQVSLVPDFKHQRIPQVAELARMKPDVLLLQSFLQDGYVKAIELYRRFLPKIRLIFELDDLKTEMPSNNPKARTMPHDVGERLAEALSYCDRMIVTTEPLKQAYSHLIDDIVVVPNRLERSRWDGLSSKRRAGTKPRVGWAGAQQHHGDLELLREVVEATADEVEWVFFGMCPQELRPYIQEFHEGVVFEAYPTKLASLNLDLAVAPLEINRFNEAKSNLRLLEYGIMGWPVVCTDIEPYRAYKAPVTRVANTSAAWVDAIRQHVYDLDSSERAGDRLHAWVQRHWMLEDHLESWLDAFTQARSVPSKTLAVGGR